MSNISGPLVMTSQAAATSGGQSIVPTVSAKYPVQIIIPLTTGTWTTGSLLVDQQIAPACAHMAHVEIGSISLVYTCSTAGIKVGAGLAIETNSFDMDTVFALEGNFLAYSNAMNCGSQVTHHFTWPGEMSNQLKPIPSNLPRAKFLFDCADGVTARLIIWVTYQGVLRFSSPSILK